MDRAQDVAGVAIKDDDLIQLAKRDSDGNVIAWSRVLPIARIKQDAAGNFEILVRGLFEMETYAPCDVRVWLSGY